MGTHSWRIWRFAVAAAAMAALASSVYLAVAPAYAGIAAAASASVGSSEVVYSSAARPTAGRTLAEVNGRRIYLVLILPILLAGFPISLRSPAGRAAGSLVSALLLLGFVILTGFSIGSVYTPAALIASLGALAGGIGVVLAPSSGTPGSASQSEPL